MTVPPGTQVTNIQPGMGSVVVKVEGGRLALSYVAWTGLTVRNLQRDTTYTITPTGTPRAPSLIFVSQLPPGEYRFEKIEGNTAGLLIDLMISNTARADIEKQGALFRVEAGTVTNLGVLHAYLPAEKSDRNLRLAPGGTVSDRRAVFRDLQLDPALSDKAIGGWSRAPNSAATAIDELKKNAMVTNGRYQIAADGSYWVGARTGQVLRRDPSGRWSNFDTGLAAPITAVLPQANGFMLAGSTGGLVMHSTDGKRWNDISLPLGGELVALNAAANEQIVAVVAQGAAIKVFSSRCCDQVAWRELSLPAISGTPFLVTAHTLGTKLIVQFSEVAFLSTRKQLVINLDSLEAAYVAPFDAMLPNAQPAAIRNVLCGNDYLSTDGGKTWSRPNQPGSALICRSASILYSVSLAGVGWSSSSFSFHRSTDRGVSWEERVARLPEAADVGGLMTGGHGIVPLPKDGELLLHTGHGRTFFSADDGKTWTLEREVSDSLYPFLRK
ncbi:sialidase family protein [Viridibacterium curvum]|uniref:sialidase family protein n=1 Tax=Viridibacterium curvum TaxID=1101404 RepID=UPI0031E9A345